MRSIVIGTAGHIDHGKSALVRALTGVDPDRLPEEKKRGITIDLGFAELALAPDLHAAIVDVPGHERFVKNMVAGTGGIDLCLLVVAADEGVMPQTREHVDICHLLGIRRGVVALTKIDLTPDPAWQEEVLADLGRELAGTFLEASPKVRVSSRTGQGLAELKRLLLEAGRDVPPRNFSAPPFLPIDRIFSAQGFGTVVTGTLLTGQLRSDGMVDIVPDPGGKLRKVKIRALQSHGREQPEAFAGQRVAVNLSGVAQEELSRGQVICQPGFQPSRDFESRLELVAGAEARPARFSAILYAGTAKSEVRVRLWGAERLSPGEAAFARIHAQEPLALFAGQRFILRGFAPIPGRGTTIGGGRVLDPHPPRRRTREAQVRLERLRRLDRGTLAERVSILLDGRELAGASAAELALETGAGPSEIQAALEQIAGEGGLLWTDPERQRAIGAGARAQALERAHRTLERFHQENPLLPGMPTEALRQRLQPELSPRVFRALLDDFCRRGALAAEADAVRLSTHRVRLSGQRASQSEELAALFDQAGLAPPRPEEAAQRLSCGVKEVTELLSHLVRSRRLIRVSAELFFSAPAIEDLRARLRQHLEQRGAITTQEWKGLVGTSRKFAIPLAEYFDREKVTLRVGDRRVPRTAGAGRGEES
ncbi:MAG: selenocysteine-specific translation elongation factor [Myxococcales bacterium]|nr:selenocysteine-specific translation elongation factor [Myxococcales bacterium]